jgi:hypothetical protein
MSVTLARTQENEIRLTGKPIHCSACFNSQDIEHIDFDAACDRGYGGDAVVKVSMDDLILCANCVKTGARLIGMTDEAELLAENERLKERIDTKDKALKQAQRYATTMEEAIAARPEPLEIDHRKLPRKDLAGVGADA